ncbi:DUF6114 domain-containing protein [Micromonospora sp. PLK6-60]|uniref:DUF6114 domain-containing protein n=1 Tax=Micromonospora sp. PLK6-60 TaxID=2873383 RepID=UPI001CA74EF1|nr:DUF6114 domain-containing protein [Micromonospora sp. PLK6-60]MBY8872844.1 DUF6114 domain-containing protein [Micromonospora sp. PLK6-60]
MTSVDPRHARPGRTTGVRRRFRNWRRSRPFWGGLLTALAGVELLLSSKLTLAGLSLTTGPTGFLSWVLPAALLTCGLLIWFSPGQRVFYAIVAAVTAVYSLKGLNFGGFFVGLLLGMVGSALAFAWTPTARPRPDGAPTTTGLDGEPATGPGGEAVPGLDGEPATTGPDLDGASTGPDGEPRASGREGDEPPPGREPGPSPASSAARFSALGFVAVGLVAAGLLGVAAPAPVRAAARDCPAPSSPAPSSPAPASPAPASPAPSGSRSPGTPAAPTGPAPSPSPSRDGNLITDLIHGIGDLLTGGRADRTPSPTPTPTATSASPGPGPSGGATRPAPDGSSPACPVPTRSATPVPTGTGEVEPGAPLPRIAPEPGQPRVAARPSKLTGSKVTMTGLRFDGTVDLPTVRGTLRVLKFSMRRAVTDDFLLRADGPAGTTARYATDRLTVSGNVSFYATRFVGRLVGIKITLTPDLPLPDGIPVTSPIPITFTDPVIDLAYVTSDTLTARPALRLDLA